MRVDNFVRDFERAEQTNDCEVVLKNYLDNESAEGISHIGDDATVSQSWKHYFRVMYRDEVNALDNRCHRVLRRRSNTKGKCSLQTVKRVVNGFAFQGLEVYKREIEAWSRQQANNIAAMGVVTKYPETLNYECEVAFSATIGGSPVGFWYVRQQTNHRRFIVSFCTLFQSVLSPRVCPSLFSLSPSRTFEYLRNDFVAIRNIMRDRKNATTP